MVHMAPTNGRASPTILLVAANVHLRRMVRRLLEVRGYDVVAAESLDEAGELVAGGTCRIGVSLVDLESSSLGMDALAERTRPLHAAAPVVYLSTSVDSPFVRGFAEAAGARHLRKPFNPDELDHAVREALGDLAPAAL